MKRRSGFNRCAHGGINRADVRARLGISQAAFAARYHIPIGTLRDWEPARKHPAPALAYLRVIAKEPTARALAVTG